MDGGWSVRVRGYNLSVGGSSLMIEGWMFIGRGVREDSLDGRVLDSSGACRSLVLEINLGRFEDNSERFAGFCKKN